MPLTALTRLEKTGGGTAATLAALLHFYQGQGINLAWVLTPDNAQVSCQAFQDAFVDMRTQEASHALVDLRRMVQSPAADLRIGNEPNAEGQPPLLAQIREGIHRALVYLLPRIALIESEVDFRQFQRVMPPVALRPPAGVRRPCMYRPTTITTPARRCRVVRFRCITCSLTRSQPTHPTPSNATAALTTLARRGRLITRRLPAPTASCAGRDAVPLLSSAPRKCHALIAA